LHRLKNSAAATLVPICAWKTQQTPSHRRASAGEFEDIEREGKDGAADLMDSRFKQAQFDPARARAQD
jgi:hypothetical protein